MSVKRFVNLPLLLNRWQGHVLPLTKRYKPADKHKKVNDCEHERNLGHLARPADGGPQSDGIAYQTIHVYVITHII